MQQDGLLGHPHRFKIFQYLVITATQTREEIGDRLPGGDANSSRFPGNQGRNQPLHPFRQQTSPGHIQEGVRKDIVPAGGSVNCIHQSFKIPLTKPSESPPAPVNRSMNVGASDASARATSEARKVAQNRFNSQLPQSGPIALHVVLPCETRLT